MDAVAKTIAETLPVATMSNFTTVSKVAVAAAVPASLTLGKVCNRMQSPRQESQSESTGDMKERGANEPRTTEQGTEEASRRRKGYI